MRELHATHSADAISAQLAVANAQNSGAASGGVCGGGPSRAAGPRAARGAPVPCVAGCKPRSDGLLRGEHMGTGATGHHQLPPPSLAQLLPPLPPRSACRRGCRHPGEHGRPRSDAAQACCGGAVSARPSPCAAAQPALHADYSPHQPSFAPSRVPSEPLPKPSPPLSRTAITHALRHCAPSPIVVAPCHASSSHPCTLETPLPSKRIHPCSSLPLVFRWHHLFSPLTHTHQ